MRSALLLLVGICWLGGCDWPYQFPIVGTACESGTLTPQAGETDVDCGGGCPQCDDGRRCQVNTDCKSGFCVNGTCEPAPTCTDGIKNAAETDVDCGGSDCLPCGDGQGCLAPTDCDSGLCVNNRCQPKPTCTDHAKNGVETDVDCGGQGNGCLRCADYRECLVGDDCDSKVCKTRDRGNQTCEPNSCSDQVHNGSETDVDCGGRCSANCPTGKMCSSASDCVSGVCTSGVCG